MAKQKIYRQGDVLFVKISSFPKKEVKKLTHRIIAEGEMTGHKHEILEDTAVLFEESTLPNPYANDNQLADSIKYLEAIDDSKVIHNEHGAILLPKGKYRIVIQREYSPKKANRGGYYYVRD